MEEIIRLAKKIGYQKGINEVCKAIREKFENETFSNTSDMKVALYETLVEILANANETEEAES